VAGVVTRKRLEPGQVVQAGRPHRRELKHLTH